MKQVVFLLTLVVFVGCGGKQGGGDEALRFDVEIDTVMVNPGQEILFLNAGLYGAVLSTDKKYLYNFNHTEFSMEKIDLESLAFVRKIEVSKEGPNGVGQYFMGILPLDEERLLFRCYRQDNVLDWEAKKLRQFDFTKIGDDENKVSEEENFYSLVRMDDGLESFLGLANRYREKVTTAVHVNLTSNSAKRYEIPLFEKTKKFQIEIGDGGSFGVQSYLVKEGGKAIVCSEISSDMYVYSPESDSFEAHTYHSELTAAEKTGTYPTTVGGIEDLAPVFRRMQEEIAFMPPRWDEINEVFYRFSFNSVFDDSVEQPENSPIPRASGAKVYLTVYDKDLNMIAESFMPMISTRPPFHFVKDGKLWVFENIEDEMGFVTLSISGV
ncbi:hypothetical protein ADIS_3892 [Lunatimonas lonarensis]|uniref:Lipoprotein n=1 Tax=Lunatimonas lonarensis TaxID=1232681 RepID=R7ZNL8_9BACT|nr:DUF4221 family protein [Lunatimonas lonarensis]EON75672.1 hypothetical protein ADIS_3892 [Lunatimonas lonarensis]